MEKYNPLFVDSTKFRGDLIRSNFELKNVMVYDDEELFVVITDRNGTRESKLKWLENSTSFEANIHLPHQALISYQFVIRKGEQKVYQSVVFEGQAQYAMTQDWMPVLEDPAPLPATADPAGNDEWSPRKSVVAVHSLIEKWGF